jgi:hypothetical protein
MKNLLSTIIDMMLFCLLIVILITPLLVSFNLDPQLYAPNKSNITGVSDIKFKENFKNFNFIQNTNKSDRIKINNPIREKNYYKAEIKVIKGKKLDEQITLGRIVNDDETKQNFSLNLYSDKKSIQGVKIYTNLNGKDYELFDGENFKEINFSVDPNSQADINLLIKSDYSILYEFESKLDLKQI